jgi:hypothetical protein
VKNKSALAILPAPSMSTTKTGNASTSHSTSSSGLSAQLTITTIMGPPIALTTPPTMTRAGMPAPTDAAMETSITLRPTHPLLSAKSISTASSS